MEQHAASTNISSFRSHLATSHRVLVLVGAGLSASSGIPTFRGARGLWNKHDVKELASPYGFRDNPPLVWSFYNERRQVARNASPNAGHFALADFAKRKSEVVTVTQNIDGLSERVGHPRNRLHLLHGSLSITRCNSCPYSVDDDWSDRPVGPPRCPLCNESLRPGVIWFSEKYSDSTTSAIEAWVEAGRIDLVLVIGTSMRISLVADYLERAMELRARVAVVNLSEDDAPSTLEPCDWFFKGDAAILLPALLN